jgi:glycosyltransferase involved in cell wall biosynthesis
MKICLLTPTFLPKIGGTEISLAQLASEFQRQGHWVGVLTQQPRRLEARDHELPYPVRRYRRPWTLRGNFFGMRLAMSRWHSEIGFDVVSSHTAYPSGWAATLWGCNNNVPVAVTCRGGDVSGDSRFRRSGLIIKRLSQCLNDAAAVTVLSENMIQNVRELSAGCEPRVIYNGVDASLSERVAAPQSEAWYNAVSGQPYLLAMGRLHAVKGFDVLIEAYAAVRDRLTPKSKLIIAGVGGEEDALRKLIDQLGLTNEIVLTGEVRGTAKSWLLQHCRAFVLSSHREGFPMVLLEAMICGRAVLATRCVDQISLVSDGRVGPLVTPGSVESLAEGLLNINNRDDLSAIGQIAQDRAKECLWERIAQRYIELFDAAIRQEKYLKPKK